MRGLRTPLLIVITLSFAFGLGWGVRLIRGRENARGQFKGLSVVHVLSVPEVISDQLLEKFQESEHSRLANRPGHGAIIDIAKTTAELVQKLENGKNKYDVVLFMSYQFDDLARRGLIRRIDPPISEAHDVISSDFIALPDNRAREMLTPLLWGINGFAVDSGEWDDEPDSWKDLAASGSAAQVALGAGSPFLSALATAHPDEVSAVQLNQSEMLIPPYSQKPWSFVFPEEKGLFWLLGAGIPQDVGSLDNATVFIRFLLQEGAARELVSHTHQASTNHLLETSDVDEHLKPSYIRQVPLTNYGVMHDPHAQQQILDLLSAKK